jgi:hypothetical protein
VLLWFVGLSLVIVWLVFRSPGVDYRMVALGAVLPLGDLLTGGVWLLHTLAASVAVLLVVVLLTMHRRLARRRWLGVPIGMFLHLLLDGMWTRTEVFWWPAFGWDALGGPSPESTRSAALLVGLEVAGLLALIWFAARFQLRDPANRSAFLRSGRVPRDVAPES